MLRTTKRARGYSSRSPSRASGISSPPPSFERPSSTPRARQRRHPLRDRLYAVACASMLVYGIVLGLPGTVLGLPETAAEFGLTLTSRGSLISALFVGLLIGSVVSGAVVHALGYRASLALSSG